MQNTLKVIFLRLNNILLLVFSELKCSEVRWYLRDKEQPSPDSSPEQITEESSPLPSLMSCTAEYMEKH